MLRAETIKTRQPESEPRVRVAITDDTGSGKSATVNSIPGVDNLTPEMCSIPRFIYT
jgi:predicted GTPase